MIWRLWRISEWFFDHPVALVLAFALFVTTLVLGTPGAMVLLWLGH